MIASVPEEIKDVIESMINSASDRHRSALEVFKTVDGYIKARHPALHAQILEDVKRNYPGSIGLFNA